LTLNKNELTDILTCTAVNGALPSAKAAIKFNAKATAFTVH
jgi:hypothetical protein